MIIKGEKINLRSLTLPDADSLYENVKDKEIAEFTTVPHPYPKDGAKEFIEITQKQAKDETGYQLGIEFEGKIIGMISLMSVSKVHKNANLGYWLGKKFWKRGFTSEAVKLILKFGFIDLKLEKISVTARHPNEASINLIKKIGFVYEGTARKDNFKWGKWTDHLNFSMLREEYDNLF